jgi:hypothetical protein
MLEQASAAASFDIIGKEYVDSILKSTNQEPPDILYHYTDALGLESILKNRSLWFSDIFSMNDPSEIAHGIKIAQTQLTTLLTEGLSSEKAEILSSKFFLKALEGIKNIAHFFVCCFSKEMDDLGQWRAYANDGQGYALGFDGKALDSYFSNGNKHHNSFPIHYDEAKLASEQKGLANLFLKHLSNKNSDLNDTRLNYDDRLMYIVHVLILSLPHKHWGYKNESEFRFMQTFPINKLVPDLLHRVRKNKKNEYQLVNYREFSWKGLDPCPIKEIVIGPAINESGKTFIRNCLSAYGFDITKIDIKTSEIPYSS